MMKYLVVLAFSFCTAIGYAQYNTITVSGGYVFANIEDVEIDASGYRFNGSYEIHPAAGKLVHGFSIGRINTSAEYAELSGTDVIESKVNIGTWPFYYAPKLLIGDGSLQGFVKGAAGMQFSTLKRTGTLPDFKSSDAGFYGGLGAGVQKEISDKITLNLEYEWAYQSNSYYSDGFINSVMFGVAFKLDK